MQAKPANSWRRVLTALVVPVIAILPLTLLCAGQSDVHAAQPEAADKEAGNKPGKRIEQPGFLLPFEQVDIYAQIMGFVKQVRVDIGDQVKKGEVLAELFTPELVEESHKRRTIVEKAKLGIVQTKLAVVALAAALDRAAAEVDAAKAALDQSEAVVKRWQAESDRVQRLLKNDVVDQGTAAEVANQLKAAQAAVALAKARIKVAVATHHEATAHREQGTASVELAKADLDLAEADLKSVLVRLDAAVIVAPFDGVVIQRGTNTGDLAGPPSAVKFSPLFTVARVDLVRVVVDVPELDATSVLVGMKAAIRLAAFEGHVFEGKVARTAASLHPKTRTLRVEIYLPNPTGKLLPGMYARVTLGPAPAQPAPAQPGQPAKEAKPAEDDVKLLKARFALAKKAYDEAAKSFGEVRRGVGNTNILVVKPDEVYTWSVRLLRAERDLNPQKADQIAALENHLKHMTALNAKVDSMEPLLGSLSRQDAEWYVLEAKHWLNREKASK